MPVGPVAPGPPPGDDLVAFAGFSSVLPPGSGAVLTRRTSVVDESTRNGHSAMMSPCP